MQTNIPKLKTLFSIIMLCIMALCYRTALADNTPRIKTDKDVYTVGETIRVDYFNAPGERRDWICIVPEGASEDDGGDYDYIPKGTSQGFITFQSPPPGKYEARAYYNYSRDGYVISARHRFTVEGFLPSPPPPSPPPAPVTNPPRPIAAPEKIKPDEVPEIKTYSTRINVAIFHFTPLSIDATQYGTTVTNTLSNSPKMRSSFVVLGKRELEHFLTSRNLQQNDKIENIIQIGSGLGLNYVVAGNIEKHGTTIVTNCKVVDIAQRDIIFEKQFISLGEADLIGNIIAVGDSIIEAIRQCTN